MFCPKCGKRNERNYKFCRGCGENLKAISKAMERRWRKLLYRVLDSYIRDSHRHMSVTAKSFHRYRWLLFTLIGIYLVDGVIGKRKDWWAPALLYFLILLAGAWDYISYKRLSASGSSNDKLSAQPASLPDTAVELSSIPTTNELASPFSVTESTTRRLEPLSHDKK